MANQSEKFGVPFAIFGMRLGRSNKQALLLFLGMLSACGGATEDRERLIGQWVQTEGDLSCTNWFHKDGTFSGNCLKRGTEAWTFNGNWLLSGRSLVYEYKESSLKKIPSGTRDADQLITVESDYYIVQSRDGVKRRYLRSATGCCGAFPKPDVNPNSSN